MKAEETKIILGVYIRSTKTNSLKNGHKKQLCLAKVLYKFLQTSFQDSSIEELAKNWTISCSKFLKTAF